MDSVTDLAAKLNGAKLTHPFSALGVISKPSKSNKNLTLRAWFPDATKVELVGFSDDKTIAELSCIHANGLFESLVQPKQVISYKFKVFYGSTFEYVLDPYGFKQQAYYAVHHLSTQPENVYNQLGAQLIEIDIADEVVKATRFCVYAPNATSCSLIGDFNQWDGRRTPMEKTECGHFVIVMPQNMNGMKYKYELKDSSGHILPHKSDPIGFHQEQYPSFASLVYDHNIYQWQDSAWMGRGKQDHYQQPMSIYEVHLGSWKAKYVDGQCAPLSYVELAQQLIPYVKEMGYTHIEVLPVTEHPFTGSWGYQPIGMFAPTSRFGNPDQFKTFIDTCHQNGIGVIIDWVPAHFPEDGHGLARFDGSHLYEYADPRKGWHPDWNSCIYDYGRDHVRQFLVASALYWFDKFHVDGIRVDAVASMLYLDYSRNDGEWIPNIDGGNHNYEAISLLQWMNSEVYKKYPNAVTVAEESTAFSGVSKPVSHGGLGFGFKWNMGWMHDTLTFISKDPAYRRFHHNDITFAMVYHYSENFVLPISHDEVVHGKGSLLRKMPGDEWQQAANLRCYAAFMYGHPGKKLSFMGCEFGQFEEWDHNSQLSWQALDMGKHSGISTLYRDLNNLYREQAALHQLDYDHAGFEWLDHDNSEQSVIAFGRKSAEGELIIVICNFTPVPRDNYEIGVDVDGDYQILLNTDSAFYWGSNYPTGDRFTAQSTSFRGKANKLTINLPPLSTLFIKHVRT